MRLDAFTVSPDAPPTRRDFLKLTGVGAFALALGPALPEATAADGAPAAPPAPPTPPALYIAVLADGTITVQVNRLEFGQGVATSLPLIVAEELDADPAQVRGVLAPAGPAYVDPLFGMQMTGGSSTMKNSWMQYRELGARARAMFVAAAARQWGVAPAEVRIERSVIRGPGAQVSSLGAMAAPAMREPVPQAVSLKSPERFGVLGRPQPRHNARAIVTGAQGYGLDFGLDAATRAQAPGLKTVLIARPPVFGAKGLRYDAAAARAVKGVAALLEVELDRGGRGVAVVADGFWAARQGRDALKAQWDTAGVERVDSDRQRQEYLRLAQQPGVRVKREGAPAAAASAEAARRLVAEYHFPYLAHAPMEPLNCVIHFLGDRCTLWAGTQFQTVDQGAVARELGLKPEQVRLNTLMAGGGFGRRAVPTSDYLVEAARIARAWHAQGQTRPLKLIWTREDDLRGGYYRPSHVHRAEIALGPQGQVLAWDHTIVGQSILTGTPFEAFMVKDGVDAVTVEGVADTPYALPLSLQVHHPKQNVPVLWWRSVGHTHTAFVMETLVDELAQAAGQDPVAYRRSLLGSRHPRHRAALDLAVAKSGYGLRSLPAGSAWGVALHESFSSVVAFVVEARLAEGRPVLVRATAGVHCNFAVNPLAVQAQVEGAALMGLSMCLEGAAITLKDGVVQQANFGDYTLPRITDMPAIDVHLVPSTEAPTGMGEPGLPPLAPAFANALARLTGKRLRELPFRVA